MNTSRDNLVFLTGSTGLLGGHMLVHLYKMGKKIRCLIRTTSSLSQLKTICQFYTIDFNELKSSVEWVFGDTLDYVSLRENLVGVHDVYHCAAIVSFNTKDSNDLLKTNIQGTTNMVDASLENGIKKFCFISSIAALGKTTDNSPISEETQRKNDERTSAYSESKYKSELVVWRGVAEGLNAVIINPGVILGAGELEKGSMLIIKTGTKGIPFYTKATTGYVDVRDVCRGAIVLTEGNHFAQRFIFVSENAHSGTILSFIAKEFDKASPQFIAGPFLLGLGVIISAIVGVLTNKTPQLTMNTLRSVQHPDNYSNTKIRTTVGFDFISIEKSIKDICTFLKKEKA